MALAAAFKDPRFLSLQPDEIDDIKIEISVLSPMQKINNPEIIEVGKHGVYITKGINSGVFLPQVATEEGWTKEQFLDNLCEHKAGIDKNAWRDGSADLYIFTAQMFEEE
jgi:AmmeMemoRadiSam system protein A